MSMFRNLRSLSERLPPIGHHHPAFDFFIRGRSSRVRLLARDAFDHPLHKGAAHLLRRGFHAERERSEKESRGERRSVSAGERE